MAGNTTLTHLTFLLDCIISPVEQGSHVIHKLHISLIKVVSYLSPLSVCAVIWSYGLTMTGAEGSYMQVRAAGVQKCPYQ